MLFGSEANSINNVKYLYLREISEPRDNSLRIIVDEAVLNPSASASFADLPELDKIIAGSSVIESTEGCKTFELFWKNYVAYLVTEECVGSCGNFDDEKYAGTIFRTYMQSHFLDYIARDTGGHTVVVQHYKLICLNHLIDVASYHQPEIKLVDGTAFSSSSIQ